MAKNYVEEAEQVINSLNKDRNGNMFLKTNQIRKLFSAVMSLNNRVELLQMQGGWNVQTQTEIEGEIRYLIVKFAYQAGRDRNVKDLVEKAKLIDKIKAIGADTDKFKQFARYMEALVAYHKYYGGKDS